MDFLHIYTDGACSGNPGAGGYGAVLIWRSVRKEISGGFRLTTNNRMEMMAAIKSLEAIKKNIPVKLYTDSQYLFNGITKGWAKKWRRNGWMRNKKEPAQNPDLWEKILELDTQLQIEWIWVRGHNGNVENERCDRLAVAASQQDNLPIDSGYEQPNMNSAAKNNQKSALF